LDAIQKSIDFILTPKTYPTKCLLINGSSKKERAATVSEIVVQFIQRPDLAKSKILITSYTREELDRIYRELKKGLGIEGSKNMIYFGSSEGRKYIDGETQKKIQHTMLRIKKGDPQTEEDKERRRKEETVAHEVLRFLRKDPKQDGTHPEPLSGEASLMMAMSLDEVKAAIFRKVPILLGLLEDWFNDVSFYITLSKESVRSTVSCCLVNEASKFTDPQIMSLQQMGVEKYILAGDEKEKAVVHNIFAQNLGFNRSLFQRLFKQCTSASTSESLDRVSAVRLD
jgi:hypothetical protein